MTAHDLGERRRAGDLRVRVRRPRLRASFVSLACTLLGLATLVSAVPFWPVYQSAEFVVTVVVTVLVGTVLGVAGAVLRLSSFAVLLVTVAAYLLLGVPLAVPSGALWGVLPTLDGLRQLVVGTALGWKQLLTISLPVGSYEALLVPLFVLLLVVSVVGTSVALRTRRGELAMAGPVVVHLAGIVLGPEDAVLPRVAGLALLTTCVAWFVWWRLRRRRLAVDALAGGRPSGSTGHGHGTVAGRAVAGTVLTLAVAASTAVGAVALLPSPSDRVVARSLVAQPFDPRDEVSPLTRFRVYEQEPLVDDEVFRVRGLAPGQLLRLATLDTYDGVSYTVGSGSVSSASGTFDLVPSTVDQSDVAGAPTSVSVDVGSYEGIWLPTVGALRDVAFSGPTAAERRERFYYNDATGTAAVVGGVSEGDAYSLRAVLPRQPSGGDLDRLTPGTDAVPAPRAVPDELSTALDGYVEGVAGPGAQLRAALEGLRAQGYVSHGVSADEPPSRSGHGADRIAQLFTDPVMVGDGEQYATAAALMADQLGFPARVVMGFVPSEEAPVDDQGAVALTGGDVTAWIEVDTAQFGWVALDPNPEERPVPEEQLQDPSQVSRPESVVQPPPQDPQVRDDQAPPQTAQEDADTPPEWLAALLVVVTVAGWLALVAGIVAAPFLAVVGLKVRRRRRRRRAASAAARITGGWREFEDAVVDHGVDTPPAATRSEVAARVGGARTAVLARVADRAVFGPSAPPEEDADRVWAAVEDLRRSLGEGLTRWQRVKAAVSLRSLRRYHGRTRPER
ncbi:hypothetical protein ABID92_000612 [Frigoribacterium sp. PvP120]|uniref:transglutaminaseTgpA domain-containing protein n=1 Tax=unclassified Frigoribacterium TaxID=2627005 RepID=UPI001B4ACCAD|nr:transglutaminaseTgpA domain-containing protein [Frigoribacterium sp. PvP121]MBP1241559.1 hypothetical protein [Frigoribacterium sp. PvP121]